MSRESKAIVLLSGGLDSAVTLWWAKRKGWLLYTITFNYFQRHQREIDSAERLAEASGVFEHKVIDLQYMKEIADSILLKEVPLDVEIKDRPAIYVPGRNTVFYGIAASWAETIGARLIIGGHNKLDFMQFPDSTPEYFALFNRLLRIGTWAGKKHPIRILTPLSKMDKRQIVKLALKLGVPSELTWSCYMGRERACGTCEACKIRLNAFKEVGAIDPLEYEIPVSPRQ